MGHWGPDRHGYRPRGSESRDRRARTETYRDARAQTRARAHIGSHTRTHTQTRTQSRAHTHSVVCTTESAAMARVYPVCARALPWREARERSAGKARCMSGLEKPRAELPSDKDRTHWTRLRGPQQVRAAQTRKEPEAAPAGCGVQDAAPARIWEWRQSSVGSDPAACTPNLALAAPTGWRGQPQQRGGPRRRAGRPPQKLVGLPAATPATGPHRTPPRLSLRLGRSHAGPSPPERPRDRGRRREDQVSPPWDGTCDLWNDLPHSVTQ